MMFMNLIWAWGHPEVYILVLPAFGIFSEVISTFPANRCSDTARWWPRPWRSASSLYGVAASFLHHGCRRRRQRDLRHCDDDHRRAHRCEVFNWLFTMYGGRVRFQTPLLWSIGFMVTFIIGGMTAC